MHLKKTVIVLLFVLAQYSFCLAEGIDDRPEVTAEVDKKEISIGDWIKFDVRARNISTEEIFFPQGLESLGEFSVLESHPLKQKWSGPRIEGREYVLSVYTTGTHVIPPIEVKYRLPGEDEWKTKESPQVPIEVGSVLTGNDTDIKDLKGLAGLGGGFFNIFLVVVVILAVAGFLYFLWRKRKAGALEEKKREKSPDVVAHEELNKLKTMDLPGKGQVKEYYIRLSDIARHYLEGRFSYRAPEMTTEEFLDEIKRSKELANEHKDLLKEFLSHCDLVKFAKYGPTPLEILDSFKAAERLVDQTKREEGEEDEA
jgi:hypothetical protein